MSALERMFQFDRYSLARIVECRSLDKQERGVLLVYELERRVLTLYCRITLSADRIGDSIRPSGHNPRGVRSFKIQTSCSLEIRGVFEVHFCWGSRVGMNSFSKRFQTWADSCCAKFHCFINFIGLELFLGGILAKKKMVRGQGFDVAGRRRYSRDGSCIHKLFNFAQQGIENIISEVLRSNDGVNRVFCATNETFPDATKLWCICRVELFPRYLVVSKNLVH